MHGAHPEWGGDKWLAVSLRPVDVDIIVTHAEAKGTGMLLTVELSAEIFSEQSRKTWCYSIEDERICRTMYMAGDAKVFAKDNLDERKRRVLGSAFLCVMKRLFERSGLILFLLRAKAGGFIVADGGEAKERDVKCFKNMIFHTIPLVLFGHFLMKKKSVNFYCPKWRFRSV